ncbi:MAG TPA: hypothetical protein VKP04_00100 [Ktedonobacteraceae bacterium]|nr:hypothetical protein [Ktedonobacteraceae bacterium]
MPSLNTIFVIFAITSFIISFFYIMIQWVFRKQRPFLGYIVICSTLFLLFYFPLFFTFGFNIPVASPTPNPSVLSENVVPNLYVNMSFHGPFRVQQSATIDIGIVSYMPKATSSTPSTVTSTTAQLLGSSFEIDPPQQMPQSLDQGEVHFVWTITPKYPGQQQLYATITSTWVPKSGGDPSITGSLGSISWDIPVEGKQDPPGSTPGENPLLLIGQNILLALISSVLSIPWIWDLIAKRREKKRAAQGAISRQRSETTQIPNILTQPLTSLKKSKKRRR